MPLGKSSHDRLATCHPLLIEFVSVLMKGIDDGDLAEDSIRDLTVLCGYRGKDEQEKAYREKASKLQWPKSKHNVTPSLAVDIAPYPIDWSTRTGVPRFAALRKYARGVARGMGINIRIISWDWPHYELTNP